MRGQVSRSAANNSLLMVMVMGTVRDLKGTADVGKVCWKWKGSRCGGWKSFCGPWAKRRAQRGYVEPAAGSSKRKAVPVS